jgi:hypothetical protein
MNDNVRGHKRIAVVVFPPAPTTIFVLEPVETISPALDFLLQVIGIANRGQLELLYRLRNDDVRQKTRHRLFGAAVRITRQVIERAEECSRN